MTTDPKNLPEIDAAAKKRQKLVSILSLIVMIAFFIAVMLLVGKPMLDILKNKEDFREWVQARGFVGQLAMIGMMALQVIVAIIPGEPMEIGAGYAFGAFEGTLLCLIGAAVGTSIVFAFTRTLGMKMVTAFVPKEKLDLLPVIQNAKKRNLLVFILFLIPGTPKDIITYFIGVTPMKLWVLLALTSAARIPSVLSSTLGGHKLGDQEYLAAGIVFGVTAVVSLLGVLYYRKMSKKKE